MTETPQQKSTKKHKLLVPAVLLAGLALGSLSAMNLKFEFPGGPFGPSGLYFEERIYEYLQYHIVFSTISLALLLSLIIVYARSYLQTKANFMLGLLVVLLALFLEGLLTYPLLHLFMTGRVVIDTFYSPISDVFTIVAYSVFLYLSLE